MCVAYGELSSVHGWREDGPRIGLSIDSACNHLSADAISNIGLQTSASLPLTSLQELFSRQSRTQRLPGYFFPGPAPAKGICREKEPWGARTFVVADPDENLILFAGPESD